MKKILYTISFCIILNVQPLFSQNDTLNINVGTTYNSRENFSTQIKPRAPQKEAISIKLGHFKDNLSSQLALNFYKNNEINFDNSFFKYNKGIATFTIGKINRVWSFSNKNSLILSSNARPFETFSAKLENEFNNTIVPEIYFGKHGSVIDVPSMAIKDLVISNKNNKTGKSEGILVGGNLTLIQSTIGSKTELKMKDKILFIEEIGEYAYHIDRMLYSLKRADYFENCKGLIVGQISDVKKNTTDFGRSINEIILDILDEYNFPILFDFPAGHEKTNFPIILGRKVILDVSKSDSKVIFYD